MASLDASGGVISYRALDLASARQYVTIWHLKLQTASDTLTVASLPNTSGVASLTSGITATSSASGGDEGVATITITGGSPAGGTKCVIATLHRVGRRSNLSADEDPT